MNAAATGPAPQKGLVRVMVTVCTIAACIMQALDQTIANVALPYMQGNLSASIDQVNWVLTSYIIAAAVMTAPVGWLANRFGRKRLFLLFIAGFTLASFLCGLAQNLEQLVLFRILQGGFGAALVPLSQATMLDNYTLQERPRIMSIWGGANMLGPVMGPTLGGWLTDAYGWHWVFLINVPIGILAVAGLLLFMEESLPRRELKFDWFGFTSFSVGIGALQLMLDRGEQQGWFTSAEIIAELIVSIAGFYFFAAHALTNKATFIRFEVFRDRNLLGGCISMAIFGAAVLGTLALVSPFMQNVLGYPALTTGFLLAARGVGTFASMLIMNRLLRLFEARHLMQAGFSMFALSLYLMSGFTDQTSQSTIVAVSMLQGAGMGVVFVPRNIMAFSTLSPQLRADGTSMMTLVRNLGGSIGISVLIARLSNNISINYGQLAEHLTPFNDALRMPEVKSALDLTTDAGRALADQMLFQQASIMAYADDFRLLTLLLLCALPLTLVLDSSRGLRKPRAALSAPQPEPAE